MHAPGTVDRDIREVVLLAPCAPRKILCVARNWRAHAAELGHDVPEEPLFFLKAPTAVLAPRGRIVLPEGVGRVDHEAELGVVIGRTARRIPASAVKEHVLGYTCVNDVTARALQKTLGHFTRAKGYDTFCPVGPWLETDLDPRDVRIVARKNGEVVQDGRTKEMVHSVDSLISFLSHVMTLEAGDLIATGTPSGVGPLVAGDTIEVEIEGIGALENQVIDLAASG